MMRRLPAAANFRMNSLSDSDSFIYFPSNPWIFRPENV
jgi:hypothetical protein